MENEHGISLTKGEKNSRHKNIASSSFSLSGPVSLSLSSSFPPSPLSLPKQVTTKQNQSRERQKTKIANHPCLAPLVGAPGGGPRSF